MALPNPWYIDAEARHLAPQQRLLAYSAVEGKEGVLGETHLAVTDLDTPGGSIQVMPGGYSILARHLGGAYEAYVGKFVEAETVAVNPTSSSGPRTDLVILRVENPYVSGSGSWSQPADPLNGPYVHVRVIEGVPANTNSVQALNGTWSAITLARITRPASTGVVQQSHVTDLRSLAKLGGERVIIVDPPDEPDPPAPPIAQAQFFDAKSFSGSEGTLGPATSSSWSPFPSTAYWDVAIPSWATGVDVLWQVNNIRLETKGVFGETRINLDDGAVTTPGTAFDLMHTQTIPGWQRHPLYAAGTMALPSSQRGKIKRFRVQMRLTAADGGLLRWNTGTNMVFQAVFKQYPIYG